MVNLLGPGLDRTFAALADPTRRAMLMQLDQNPGMSISELAQPFEISLPAIMKHLDVLTEAGLVNRTKTGRTVACEMTAGPLEDAAAWIERYSKHWESALDRLADYVENEEESIG